MPTEKSSGSTETDKMPAPKEEAKVASKKKEAPAPPAPRKKSQEPLVSFARWFQSKKFKPHWAAGMEAYADISRRRTMAEWDRLFKNY